MASEPPSAPTSLGKQRIDEQLPTDVLFDVFASQYWPSDEVRLSEQRLIDEVLNLKSGLSRVRAMAAIEEWIEAGILRVESECSSFRTFTPFGGGEMTDEFRSDRKLIANRESVDQWGRDRVANLRARHDPKTPDDVKNKTAKLQDVDDAGGEQGEEDGKPANGASDEFAPPTIEEHPYRFECHSEIVQVHGFGESVALERTEGVERLIAIVTKGRVNVMELARIGAPQQGRDRSSVDVDADRLSERESVNDERFESRLGDDAPSAVQESIRNLIEQRDAASARGDDQVAGELTAQINAALQCGKTAVQAAAGTVRKSLNRTYKRLRKDNLGVELAKHFVRFAIRPRGKSDYVYAPDESLGKIVWKVK